MALLWADGFDHYGNSTELNNTLYDGMAISGGARTGTSCAQCAFGSRFNFPDPVLAGGMGLAFYFNGFSDNRLQLMTAGGAVQLGIVPKPSGAIEFWNGAPYESAVIFTTPPGLIKQATWQYWELAWHWLAAPNQFLQLRVNNTVVADLSNLSAVASVPSGQFWPRLSDGGYIDDLVLWDRTGDINNDWLGDIRCRTFMPATNGPLQDWVPTNAPAYSQIDNIPAVDAQYIAAANVGDKSNFGHAVLPINTAYVAAIVTHTRVSKTDAGVCEVTAQISSNGVVANGNPISPGTSPAYYQDVFEKDPNTSGYWTRAGADAALAQIERTA